MAGIRCDRAVAPAHRLPLNGSVSIGLWSNIQCLFFSLEGLDMRRRDYETVLFLVFRDDSLRFLESDLLKLTSRTASSI